MPIGAFHRHVTRFINEALKAEARKLAPPRLMREKLHHNKSTEKWLTGGVKFPSHTKKRF